jgi:hypothetical protein
MLRLNIWFGNLSFRELPVSAQKRFGGDSLRNAVSSSVGQLVTKLHFPYQWALSGVESAKGPSLAALRPHPDPLARAGEAAPLPHCVACHTTDRKSAIRFRNLNMLSQERKRVPETKTRACWTFCGPRFTRPEHGQRRTAMPAPGHSPWHRARGPNPRSVQTPCPRSADEATRRSPSHPR